jgi:hypothetical protein
VKKRIDYEKKKSEDDLSVVYCKQNMGSILELTSEYEQFEIKSTNLSNFFANENLT